MAHGAYAHFIGIGGAGVSGLARVLSDRGYTVTGSDLKASRYAAALEAAGVKVTIGHDAANLGEPEVVVVSSAIPESNPELTAARERGIPVWPRAKMLAHLAGDDVTITVAGTHGKTTTSSMLATALDSIGLDPTFLIGGELNDMGANARCGSGGYYVVEADESDGSFLFMSPHVSVITNIEADHLDHYGSFAEIVRTFAEFIGRTSPDGAVVACADDACLAELARKTAPCRVVTYGMAETADVRCSGLTHDGIGHAFSVSFPDCVAVRVRIAIPGEHMVRNATGVLAAVWSLGLDVERAAAALGSFSGVRRRFDTVGEVAGVRVVDDYAHHPTEVRATLAGAREAGFDRIWAVFQPHRYSRTEALGAEFGGAFGDADRIVLMDVYSAGEAPIPGISGKTILDALLHCDARAQVAYFPHRGDVEGYVTERVRPGDLVMTMGAGDVTTIGPELLRALVVRDTGRAT
ncbi:MAG: UDP-N-acetylmuramate--L-alanine ligase [Actinobacteria bacterium]|nr:UDP-N-acetylmuramate--L-alanine ligase [Actinomycetota bacterium]